MEVTLLGTGDTTGTPTPGCDCETCRRARERGIERSRFSVHVRNEHTGECLLVDLSPDFRAQFLREEVALPDAAVVTHIHFDHLDGLGNVYRLLPELPVYAADEPDPVTGESVTGTIERKYDYLDRITVHPRTPYEPFEVCGFDCRLVPVEHPPLVCYGLVVEEPETGARLAMTGDTNYGVGERSREALSGADLLLVDAIVHAGFVDDPSYGDHYHDGVPYTFATKHMTFEGGRAIAGELDAGAYRLVHVSHFPPADVAFGEDRAVDGERFTL
jgi:phosphoribosyl 1,2-cyclic phosphate phosphodiesterase